MATCTLGFARRLAATSIVLIAASYVAGCDNYTVTPVCNDDNAAVPPGIAGTYTFSTQNEDWSTTTQEITVETQRGGRLLKISEGGREEESRVCQVNGQFIDESFSEAAKGYSQSRLYVTGMGISELPVFFDRPSLDAAGIETLVVELPETALKMAKSLLSRVVSGGLQQNWLASADDGDEEPRLALIIRNEAVDARQLMTHSKAGPVGLTFLRK